MAPTGTVMLPSTVDTGKDGSCTLIAKQTGGPDLCVIAAGTLEVGSTTFATGTRPLVLIGADTVRVSGTLDASSRHGPGGRTGAGANTGTCAAAGAGKNDAGGGGGGAGGSLATAGGKGGLGDGNNSGAPAGTATGGAPGDTQMPPMVLRGGCPGGAGGAGRDTGDGGSGGGGAGGDGGGALYLIAGNLIDISGSAFASGAGGSVAGGGGGAEQGAGGGGSGGMIGLDAPAIQVIGRIAANGGAGAGGGGDQGGSSGGDGTTMSWNQRAMAGRGDTVNQQRAGGDGAAGTAVGGTDQLDGHDAIGAGGGAAGGLGIVWVDGALTGGTMISPAPTPH